MLSAVLMCLYFVYIVFILIIWDLRLLPPFIPPLISLFTR